MIVRLWHAIQFPPPYEGAILTGRIDSGAYLLGWTATFAHVGLWIVVLALGLHRPWQTISTAASVIATLFLLTIVIVIHRRMGSPRALTRAVIWQWWLGPWDPVGRLVWLPVRLGEAARTFTGGARD